LTRRSNKVKTGRGRVSREGGKKGGSIETKRVCKGAKSLLLKSVAPMKKLWQEERVGENEAKRDGSKTAERDRGSHHKRRKANRPGISGSSRVKKL